MGLPNYIPERDGTLSGLLLLEMMVYEKKNFKRLVEDMERLSGESWDEVRYELLEDVGYDFALALVDELIANVATEAS